jgi:hypothetical protein
MEWFFDPTAEDWTTPPDIEDSKSMLDVVKASMQIQEVLDRTTLPNNYKILGVSEIRHNVDSRMEAGGMLEIDVTLGFRVVARPT